MQHVQTWTRRQILKQAGFAIPAYWAGLAAGQTAGAGGAMIVHSRQPHNAEPRLDRLVEHWLTPNELLYVRSHAPVPQVNIDSFRLSVEGMVERPYLLSLPELTQQFTKQTTVATLTCAGNRRSEHSAVRPVGGVPWQSGAIGNASWGGARLSELLRRAGLQDGARHVWFDGMDRVERPDGVIPFGGSIPLEKAMADAETAPGALVAYEMNGEPLTPDHGFPLRTVVPGYIGARSVKWLGRIIVSDRPSPNYYVSRAYRLVGEDRGEAWSAADPLGVFPINSVTCIPAAASQLSAGPVQLRGYALAAGSPGRTVDKVEVSADGGDHWQPATFTSPARPFCWRLWQTEVQVSGRTSELIVRAVDSAGNQQPAAVDWNLKGYLFNGWHRTPIEVS